MPLDIELNSYHIQLRLERVLQFTFGAWHVNHPLCRYLSDMVILSTPYTPVYVPALCLYRVTVIPLTGIDGVCMFGAVVPDDVNASTPTKDAGAVGCLNLDADIAKRGCHHADTLPFQL